MSPDLELLWSELTLLAEHPERRGVVGGDLAVSHHAVLRYRQRVEGVPRVRARHRMAELAAVAEWEERPRPWMPVVLHPRTTYGYPPVRPDVCLLERDGLIVTVLSERFLREQRLALGQGHRGRTMCG